jgi:predicted acetyltransferase
MSYDLRTPVADDWDEIFRLLVHAFNDTGDEAASANEKSVWEPERSTVATTDGVIAGHASAFTRDLVVPGGVVPAAYVTMVGVGATHRRRGLLTRMMAEMHRHAAERDEPIAVLWASEGKIYQRFGYGLAAQKCTFEAQSRTVVWRAPLDTSRGRLVEVPADKPDPFRAIYDAAYRSRPGWSDRDDKWWAYVLEDSPSHREGAAARRAVVHHDEHGEADGYLLWRVKADWNEAGPQGAVLVREVVALTPEAYQALYEFALTFDLTRSIVNRFAAADEPIRFMVTEPRSISMRMSDGLWIRIIDLPSALTSRRYAAPVDVVLDVTDPDRPGNAGCWHLVGGPDAATCVRTDAPADLAVDVNALGAAYLGGVSLAILASGGGSVRELRPGTLAPAAVAFGWHRQPSATELF